MLHEGSTDVRAVVDAQAERDDEHDDRHRVQRLAPEVHVPHDVDDDEAEAEADDEHSLGGDEQDGDDNHHTRHRGRDVTRRLGGDGLVLLVREPRVGKRKHVAGAVAGNRLERVAERIHRLDLIVGLVALHVVTPHPGGDDALVRHVVRLVPPHDVALEGHPAAADGGGPRVKIGESERAGGTAVGVERLDPGAHGRLRDVRVRLEGQRRRQHQRGAIRGVNVHVARVHGDGISQLGKVRIGVGKPVLDVRTRRDEVVDVGVDLELAAADETPHGDGGEPDAHGALDPRLDELPAEALAKSPLHAGALVLSRGAARAARLVLGDEAADDVALAPRASALVEDEERDEPGHHEREDEQDAEGRVEAKVTKRGKRGVGADEEGEDVGGGRDEDGRAGGRQRLADPRRRVERGVHVVVLVHDDEHVVHADAQEQKR